MTNTNATNRLEELLDDLVFDLMAISDDDLLVEAEQELGGVAAAVADATITINAAIVGSGRRLREKVRARAAARGSRAATEAPAEVKILSFADKKRLFDQLIADRRVTDKLTLAARKGEAITEEELDGLLDDLARLGFDFDMDKHA
ncbi:hypothetical protein [Magnetospirillum molischianum]|uniref:Uncharacterized protein n=1 Tax=Magnetospirillum molischianum DSM 120 TaxID=1150626 RepID=H8FTA2_MAGML|nr:hypothetical protein [Magnetospirillum molischianum]CCG41590.1 conserved hypothetical protein [Magnetospirillum molischianum DSM 120]